MYGKPIDSIGFVAQYDPDLAVMMGTLNNEVLDYYLMIKMVYDIAEEEKDFNVMAMLINFMNKITVVVSQMNTLKDKAEQLPTEFDTYDNHISEWGINGLNLEG